MATYSIFCENYPIDTVVAATVAAAQNHADRTYGATYVRRQAALGESDR